MHQLTFAIGLFIIAGTAIAAPIYVTKDEAGNPVFSDQGTENSKQVEIQKTVTYDSSGFLKEYKDATSSTVDEETTDFKYQTLTVSTPGGEEAIRDNAGNLELLFVIEPGPQPGHSIALMMDGKKHSTVTGTGSLILANVDRGTHQFHLQVTRTADKLELQVGPSTSVTVLRRALP